LFFLSDIIVWRHRSVSLNNEKICCEISEDKIAFCEKTAGLRRGRFSDSNSACLKVLVPVKIFQFQDMLNESERYQDAANGLIYRYKVFCCFWAKNRNISLEHLTVILRTRVEYELIADEARCADSAIAHIRREWVE
jgi:hypothetical protein